MSDQRLTIANAHLRLEQETTKPFITLFRHGSLEVEFYKPVKIDGQEPHSRDEIYVVASGAGEFVCGDEQHPFEAGEVLFAPAGVEHRFVNFTEDFATWVFFYGPEGGEAESKSDS